jgi:hypothetical protein
MMEAGYAFGSIAQVTLGWVLITEGPQARMEYGFNII